MVIRDDVPASYRDRANLLRNSGRRSPVQVESMGPTEEQPEELNTDDIFGDSPRPSAGHDGEHWTEISAAEGSEVPSLRRLHETTGYREGVTVSKAQFLQDGFDEGFALGAEIGMRVGWILGAFEGYILALRKNTSTEQERRALEDFTKLAESAKDELRLEILLGPQWVNEEGLWKWEVPNEANEDAVTFKEVAVAHPTVSRWTSALSTQISPNSLKLEFPRS